MPGKLFGIDFGVPRSSPQLETSLGLKLKGGQTTYDSRRTSMDFKRPGLGLVGKKHGSRDHSTPRSSSKSKDGRDSVSLQSKTSPVKLGMMMESPPALMIDSPSHSSGALISGRLQVTPNVDEVTLNSISMFLECRTSTKRPVQDRCRNCASQVKDLFEWTFLTKPTAFKGTEGMQELPFSHLIPGHLPATTHGQIGSIEYVLHVRARAADGQETELRREVIITRALRPGNEKNSVRVFPPTNLTLNVTLPNVIYPIGEFPVLCRMTGTTTKRDDTQTRWRLRKLSWRIEEHETCVSPACSLHAPKVGGEGKGVQHESSRDIGLDEMKSGWKTDFSDGSIEGEFLASINSSVHPQCGVEAQHGMKIDHHLVLELVIAEEWASNRRPDHATPTGAARVLRTQFKLSVTQRAGMGIAWDDEQPPMYEDVPASPPRYIIETTSVEPYEGDDLHGDVEVMRLDEV